MADTPRPADPLTEEERARWMRDEPPYPGHDATRAPRSDVLRRAAVNAAPVVEALGEADRAPRSDVDVDETRDAQHDEEVDWAAPRSDDALRAAAKDVCDAWFTPDPAGGYGNEYVWRTAMKALRAALATPAAPPTPVSFGYLRVGEGIDDPGEGRAAAPPTEDDPELAAHAAGWSPDRHGGSEL